MESRDSCQEGREVGRGGCCGKVETSKMLASRLTIQTKLVNSNVDKYVDVACIFLSSNERYIMALIPPIYGAP